MRHWLSAVFIFGALLAATQGRGADATPAQGQSGTVTVAMPPSPAPTATLTATPNPIERGQSTTLRWTTQNATDVSLDGAWGAEALGSRTVSPVESTTYRLTAKGPGGEVVAATPVNVTVAALLPEPTPTAALTAFPHRVTWGDSATLSWTTVNATDVSIEGIGAVGTTGSQRVTPAADTTYSLVAKGPGGTTEATAGVAVELPKRVCISLPIDFELDKSDLKFTDHGEIGNVARFLKAYPTTTAVIEGHTDSVGTRAYNKKLSLRRADAVVACLVDQYEIAPARLSSKGFGFSRPVAENATAEGRQKNRRIDAVIDCAAVR